MSALNLVCDHCYRTDLVLDTNGFIASVRANDERLSIEGLHCPECECSFIVTCEAGDHAIRELRMDHVERCDDGAARDERVKEEADADCARDAADAERAA